MRRSDGRIAAAAAGLVVLALAVSACGPTGVETIAAQGKAAAVTAPTPGLTSPAAAPQSPAAVVSATPTATPTPVIPSNAKRIGIDSTLPNKTQTVGVGMPVVVMFDRKVPDSIKPAVQARAMVTTSKDIGAASWAWLDDSTLAFRPRSFWPANTAVRLTVDLKDVYLGESDGKVYAGADDEDLSFKIGRSMVSTVNLGKQMMTVRVDGKKVRSIPVSTGKSGWETRQGIKIVMERTPNKIFTNTAVGDMTEEYVLTAKYALRITWSGEFLHSAPWAYGRLGRFAGSHGCTNMTNSDGGWLYDNAYYGDPVIYDGKKSAPEMESRNGWGGLWNIGWSKWRAKSASNVTGWSVGTVTVGKAPANKQVVYQNPDVVTSTPGLSKKPKPSAKPTASPSPSPKPSTSSAKPTATPSTKPSPKPTAAPAPSTSTTAKPKPSSTSGGSAKPSASTSAKPSATSSAKPSAPSSSKPAPTTSAKPTASSKPQPKPTSAAPKPTSAAPKPAASTTPKASTTAAPAPSGS